MEVYAGYSRTDARAAVAKVDEAARQRTNGNGRGPDQGVVDPLNDMTKDELLDLLRRITRRLEA